jgi:hypothetical protein
MLTKIYQVSWLLAAIAAGLLFVSGNLSALTTVVFGFIAFGLVFAGMMIVLPATIAHPEPVKSIDQNRRRDSEKTRTVTGQQIRFGHHARNH